MFQFKTIGKTGTLVIIGIMSLVMRLTAGYFNPGYLAVDDQAIVKYSVPAQYAKRFETLAGNSIAETTTIRSPVPLFVIDRLAKIALVLGLTDPLDQIRLIYEVLGVFSLLSLYFMYRLLERTGNERYVIIGTALMGLHFVVPFLSTRTLIEFMASPFLLASLYHLTVYHTAGEKRKSLDLVISVGWLTLASVIRFQAGVVLPVLFYIAWKHRGFRDVPVLLASGAVFFVGSGLIDVLFGKTFHESVYQYIYYNLLHSSEFGISPFYTYLPAIFFLGFGPFLIAHYRNFPWRAAYAPLVPTLLFTGLFLFAHSLIPHKEERFISTILPAIFVLITPLAASFFFRTSPIRWGLAVFLNAALLVGTIFFPSNGHLVNLVRFFQYNPEIQKLVFFENAPNQLPMQYAARSGFQAVRFIHRFSPPVQLDSDCSEGIVVRENAIPDAKNQLENEPLTQITFLPGPLDQLIHNLNPGGNTGRSPIHVFLPANCAEQLQIGKPDFLMEKAILSFMIRKELKIILNEKPGRETIVP